MIELRIWVKVHLAAALEIIDFLKGRAIILHQEARNEDDSIKSMDLRMQADDRDEDAEGIKHRLQGDE